MKRSKFSLSNYKLLTSDMGQLVPIGWFEALPGDTIQQATSMLVRVSPLVAPVMHPVHVRIHHWFVPNRLIWKDWEDFITGGPDGFNESEMPHVIPGTVTTGSLHDYLGLPNVNIPFGVSALPYRAYNLIWNEWYRDQDLETPLAINENSGLDDITSVLLQNCAWEKDYFTSARPWTQKGPDVSLPLGVMAPVVPSGTGMPTWQTAAGASALNTAASNASVNWSMGQSVSGNVPWADPALQADLSNATAANINDIRLAFALQRYEEARARYGSRYTEYLRYLGVKSSDARLQRPEYLGGGKQTIQFSEVLQTGPDAEGTGVADLKGHGIGAVRSNRYRRFFEEHGIVISLMSVKPKTMYAQGIARQFRRTSKEDYFQRELQHIGQQAIPNYELYAAHPDPAGVFGYQDRYDEYRRTESTIAGDFRTTLDHWHYARIFATPPALNADFIKSVPTKRVNAVQTEHVLWIMANHSIQARRMVAKSGTSHIF